MNIKYVSYNKNYETSWRKLFAEYWIWATDGKVTKEQNKSCQDYILQQVYNNEVQISLAVEKNETIAFCIFQIDSEISDWNKKIGWGFIREFYVNPNKRMLGIGKILLNLTIKKLKKQNIKKCLLKY